MKKILLLVALCLAFMGITLHAQQAHTTDAYIVKFNDCIQMFSAHDSELEADRNYRSVSYEQLQKYLALGIVEYYEPDFEVTLFEGTASPGQLEQWPLSLIKVESAWDIGCYGNEVKVGVIDSGAYAHDDLKGNLLPGHNYIDDTNDTADDEEAHGTFVSAIIAAQSNGSYMDGVSHCAKIVPLKCFHTGVSTTVSMISDAIYDAVDVYGCDVINMSFGMNGVSTTLQNAIKYAIDKGCIIVAAVGNYGGTTEYYPAKCADVIGVGSVNRYGVRSSFSQYNKTVDVVAPGESIPCIGIDGNYLISGTSFSTPHIAAVAAIAKCIDPDISASEFMSLLKATSTDYGTVGRDNYYGYGLVDVQNLVSAMLNQTKIFVSPIANGTLKVYNNTDVPLTALGISASYNGKNFLGATLHPLDLNPREIEEIKLPTAGKASRFMLWNSYDDMRPIFHTRDC